MKKIKQITGKAIPLDMNDVDTDLIIPAQFLTQVSKEGYGEHLFQRLREVDADFVFNQEKFQDANILIAGDNFGCGSSREHAVWALQQAGINAVIAISFADIFFNNSAKNGLVLITQPAEVINHLFTAAENGNYQLTVDIANQTITTPDETKYDFKIDPFHQHCFLNGLDELDYLLAQQQKIKTHKEKSE